MSEPRYAVYYAPDQTSSLWRFGSGVIGYDAALGRDVSLIKPEAIAEPAWRALVTEPARYGFHATLKAPFRLAPAKSLDDLLAATSALATGLKRRHLEPLRIGVIGDYLAVGPERADAELVEFAQSVVTALEPFRAPLSQSEWTRRKPDTLSLRQRELLEQYGYPCVAEEFRFHMTLAGPFADEAQQEAARAALSALFAAAVKQDRHAIDRICVFEQPDPSRPFAIRAAFPLR